MTEDEDRRSVQYLFRIMGLTVEGIEELKLLVEGVPVLQGKHFRDPTVSVAAFAVRPNCDYSWLGAFLTKWCIGGDRYGIYVSLTTSRDEDGLTVPMHVLSLCRSVGGTLDFSFCSLPDEDESG